MEFILASNNAKKIIELRDILSDMGISVKSQKEVGCFVQAEETGTTFEENAFIKAEAVARETGLPAVADDSGLVVDALGGQPGVYSARYGGDTCADDVERYQLLLKNMENQEQRSARFVSCVACVFPNGDVVRARGECEGSVLRAPRGEGGFGYDPIFLPEGSEKSMSEMTSEEKNAISHRGKALEIFKKELREYYADK